MSLLDRLLLAILNWELGWLLWEWQRLGGLGDLLGVGWLFKKLLSASWLIQSKYPD